MKLLIRTGLWALLLSGLFAVGWSAERLRIAVVDFTNAQAPASLDPAATDFSRMVQAYLLTNTEHAWVERQEFERIMHEADVAASGGTDPQKAIRLGRLARADLLLRGEIAPAKDGSGELRLELIDLRRADVLATRNVTVTTNARQQLHPVKADVDSACREAFAMIREARARLEQLQSSPVLAPLYFSNTGKTDRLDFLEARLTDRFNNLAKSDKSIRVLQFPRTGEAGAESGLILAGLTQTDPDAWQKVADVYLWGTFAEQGVDGMTFEEVPVAITLHLWTGSGADQPVQWTGPVKDLESGMRQLSTQVLASAKRATLSKKNEAERGQIAQALQLRASEVKQVLEENQRVSQEFGRSSAGRLQYAYRIKLLEIRCFFDPLNRQAQIERLEAKWGDRNPARPGESLTGKWQRAADFQEQAGQFERMPDGSVDSYWPTKLSEGLSDLLDKVDKSNRSGKLSAEEAHRQTGVAVVWWSRILEQTHREVTSGGKTPAWYASLQRSWFDQAKKIRLLDDPIQAHDALEKIWPALKAEFGRMLKTKASQEEAQRWVNFIFSVYACYADDVRPAVLLDAAWTAGQADDPQPPLTKRSAMPLPPGTLRPTTPGAFPPTAPTLPASVPQQSYPPLKAVIREMDPRTVRNFVWNSPAQTDLFGNAPDEGQIETLTWQGGKLWIAEGNKPLPAELGAKNTQGDHYLWNYDPATQQSELITAKLGGHSSVRSILMGDGTLWLGLENDGVWQYNPADDTVRRFKGADGLQTNVVSSATEADGALYYLGATPQDYFISYYSLKEKQWKGLQLPSSPWVHGPPMPPPPGMQRPPSPSAPGMQGQQVPFPPGMQGPAVQFSPVVRNPSSTAFAQQLAQLAVSGDWICFNATWSTFYNLKSKTWSNPLVDADPLRNKNPGGAADPFSIISADTDGFWIGEERPQMGGPGGPPPLEFLAKQAETNPAAAALFARLKAQPGSLTGGYAIKFFDPNCPARAESIEVPGLVVAMAHHGPWLWVLLEPSRTSMDPKAIRQLGLIDKAAKKLVGLLDLPGGRRWQTLATADQRLWVGGGQALFSGPGTVTPSALLEIVLRESRPSGTAAALPSSTDLPLLHAIWQNDSQAVDAILTAKRDLNQSAKSGWTALMAASFEGRRDLVQRLLTAGAEPNRLSKNGDTALSLAVKNGDLETVRLLLHHGADTNIHSALKLSGIFPRIWPSRIAGQVKPVPQPTDLKVGVGPEGNVNLRWICPQTDTAHTLLVLQIIGGEPDFLCELPAGTSEWTQLDPVGTSQWTDLDPARRRAPVLQYSVCAINKFQHETIGEIVSLAPKASIPCPSQSTNVIRLMYPVIAGAQQMLPAEITARPALAIAAKNGDEKMLNLLLDAGADVNLPDAVGDTPLIVAARYKQSAIVRRLLQAKARPEIKSGRSDTASEILYQTQADNELLFAMLNGMSPQSRAYLATPLIQAAAKRGRIQDIEKFVAMGGQLGTDVEVGETPLRLAIVNEQMDAALWLWKQTSAAYLARWGKDEFLGTDDDMITAVIMKNRVEFLTLLLDSGLKADQTVSDRPLIARAAQYKSFGVLDLLIARGAKVDRLSPNLSTVSDARKSWLLEYLSAEEAKPYLQRAGSPATAVPETTWPLPTSQELMHAGPRELYRPDDPAKIQFNEALATACKSGDISAASRALAAGATFNNLNVEGMTPLHHAIKARQFGVAKWLVEEGASVNRTTKDGETQLDFAVESGDLAFVEYLIRAGADVNAAKGGGKTPLQAAIAANNIAALKLLLDAGADFRVGIYNSNLGFTLLALPFALWKGNESAVDILIARGAYPVQDSIVSPKRKHISLLMFAAAGKNLSLVQKMVSAGQDPKFALTDGSDALSWAADAGATDVVQYLIPLSAKSGLAIEAARENGHDDIAELLLRAGYQSIHRP